jgi:single-stranded-DNA-specific exonuclease
MATVYNSILSKQWQCNNINHRLVAILQQKCNISELLATLLASRNVDYNEVADFLQPKLKNILPDPFLLTGVDIACNNIYQALLANKKITIFADYDVDGATSCAILVRFFRQLGIEANIYVPDRILEGYGPNTEALLSLKNNGTDLVIMVDCGTVAFAPLLAAKQAGLDIIVIDHHLGVLEKPEAIAVINPNSLGENFPYKNICAAGVVFLFLVALNKTLRSHNFFATNNLKEPDLFSLLDLVALGTVCDVMPLYQLNRAFVKIGLQILAKRQNIGIKTICDLAKINSKPTAYSLGFVIGPRINAGGRVGTSTLAATLLSTENQLVAEQIAAKLEQLNQQRKDLENNILQQAIDQLENNYGGFSCNDNVIFAVGTDWHQGVIGIIASRLKEKYNKPIAVLTMVDNQKAKASCRSVAGIDFGKAILQARMQNLIIEGGGHAMAGGFSIKQDNIKNLHNFFCQIMPQQSLDNISNYDFEIDWLQVNFDLLQEIEKLEPFGNDNPKPRFLIKNLHKISAKCIGQKQEHISCLVAAKTAVGMRNQSYATAFRANNTAIGDFLLGKNNNFAIIGSIETNYWLNNPRIQIIIDDIIPF